MKYDQNLLVYQIWNVYFQGQIFTFYFKSSIIVIFHIGFFRIYSQSSNGVESNHAETRAIYFEERIYSKRKIVDFISILKGFRTSVKIMEKLQSNIK